jgi:hypothetical protein
MNSRLTICLSFGALCTTDCRAGSVASLQAYAFTGFLRLSREAEAG